jgi:hypothetical protein
MGTPAVLLAGWAGAANAAVVPDSEHVAKLLSEDATDLAGVIADFVDYGKTRDRMERLGDKLEIPRR